MPVVTEFVARETQGCHIGRVDYVLVIAEFIVRETQDFASHKGGYAIGRGDYMSVIAEFVARETQDFASLLGRRRHLYIKGVLL